MNTQSPSETRGGNTASLYEIVRWVRLNGEIQAENRLRVRTLHLTVREGISFAQIGPSTRASPRLLSAMRREARIVVAKPFSSEFDACLPDIPV